MKVILRNIFREDEMQVPFYKGQEYQGYTQYNIGTGTLDFWVIDAEGNRHKFTQRQFENHFFSSLEY